MSQPQTMDNLVESIEKLAFIIDTTTNHQNKDYTQVFIDNLVALREIGTGFDGKGCLNQIHHELKLLNKTIIMSALLISATKNPEKTLNEYNRIIEQYLN